MGFCKGARQAFVGKNGAHKFWAEIPLDLLKIYWPCPMELGDAMSWLSTLLARLVVRNASEVPVIQGVWFEQLRNRLGASREQT